MKISVIQSSIFWIDRQKNFRACEEQFAAIKGRSDLAVLPEMFTTGFINDPRNHCEEPGGPTHEWMKRMAGLYGFAICGSYIVCEGTKYFNRMLFMSPGGDSFSYDKRHLFSMGGEDRHFSTGTQRVVFDYMGFRISPFICYDLRFPVWMRNRNDYDLLLVSANWPEARTEAWLALLKARAIENQCYVAGANRTGTDGEGIKYSGHSVLFGPKGEELAGAGSSYSAIITADLDLNELKQFRAKFPAWKDADDFVINL